jgi:hypothetical protein
MSSLNNIKQLLANYSQASVRDISLSKLGNKYLPEVERRKAQDLANEQELSLSIPHIERVKRLIAEELEQISQEENAHLPVTSVFDALQAVKADRNVERDAGLRALRGQLEKMWKKDRTASISSSSYQSLTEHYKRNYPKSVVVDTLQKIGAAGYMTLEVSKLASIAEDIRSQEDYEQAILRHGLQGNSPNNVKARKFILAMVNVDSKRPFERPVGKRVLSRYKFSDPQVDESGNVLGGVDVGFLLQQYSDVGGNAAHSVGAAWYFSEPVEKSEIAIALESMEESNGEGLSEVQMQVFEDLKNYLKGALSSDSPDNTGARTALRDGLDYCRSEMPEAEFKKTGEIEYTVLVNGVRIGYVDVNRNPPLCFGPSGQEIDFGALFGRYEAALSKGSKSEEGAVDDDFERTAQIKLSRKAQSFGNKRTSYGFFVYLGDNQFEENAQEDGWDVNDPSESDALTDAAQKVEDNVLSWLNKYVGNVRSEGHNSRDELAGTIFVDVGSEGQKFIESVIEGGEPVSEGKGDLPFDATEGVEYKYAGIFNVYLDFMRDEEVDEVEAKKAQSEDEDEDEFDSEWGRFDSPLAKKLHEYAMESGEDDSVGDASEGAGWAGLFKAEKAILYIDTQGFISVDEFDDEASLMKHWEHLEKELNYDPFGEGEDEEDEGEEPAEEADPRQLDLKFSKKAQEEFEENEEEGFEEDEEEFQEPEEGDYVIQNDGAYVVGERTHLGDSSSDYEELIRLINEDMEKNKYYPNVWTLSDHGNVSLVTDFYEDVKKLQPKVEEAEVFDDED